jgi:hypothetical protein
VDGGAEQAVSNLDNQVKPDSLSSEFSSVGGAVPTSPPDVTECCGVPDIGRYCAKCGQECRLEPSGTTGPADAPKEETHMSLGSTVPGNDSRLSPVLVTGETSDGYHTFNELYGYRKAFNALLFNEWASRGLYDVHKSWHHSDGEPCFGGGWFIVVAQMPAGQVSNHYKAEDWPLFQVPERERGAEWDGHTPQIALTRLLLQAQDSQPAQVEQPSNHTAFSAGPADAGSHETLQQRAEDLWEEVGGGLCICTISTVGHWCEKCQQRIALIKDALRAASASAPAAPREVGGAAPTSTPLDARGLITEIRAVAIAAGQFSVDVENRELSLQAFEEAARASRWADEMEKILADARAEGRRQAIREMAHLMVTMPAEAFEKWLESRLAASPASALGTGEKR